MTSRRSSQPGVVVSYETIRDWSLRFGPLSANRLKRRKPKSGDNYQFDKVGFRVRGKVLYLWRPMEQRGRVLDIVVQNPRSAKVTNPFSGELIRRLQYGPRVIVKDKFKGYAAAKRKKVGPLFSRRSLTP